LAESAGSHAEFHVYEYTLGTKTERHDVGVSSPASYSGGPWFSS